MFAFRRYHENQNSVPSQESAELCILCLLTQLSLERAQTPPRKLPMGMLALKCLCCGQELCRLSVKELCRLNVNG